MNRRRGVALLVGIIVYFAAVSVSLAGPRVDVSATDIPTAVLKAPAKIIKALAVADVRIQRHGPLSFVKSGFRSLGRLFHRAQRSQNRRRPGVRTEAALAPGPPGYSALGMA